MNWPLKKQRLFVLAEPRSGSSWLMETLNSHPEIQLITEVQNADQEIQLLGEILNHVLNSEIKKYIGGNENDFRDCLDYFERTLCVPGKKKISFNGCKILLNQLTLIGDGFPDLFLDFYRNAAIIILYRNNLVAEQISLQIAHKHDIWHVKQQDQIALKKIFISPPALVLNLKKSLRRRENIWRLLKARKRPFYALTYEELFADKMSSLDKLFTFLGLADRNVVFSSELKGNPFLPQEIIENYHEIEKYLVHYPDFHDMLIKA